MTLVDRIYTWARRKRLDRLVKEWGQIRTCPWCRQFVEEGGKHQMRQAAHNPFFDTFTCGNCGGESHWEFAPAPIYRGFGSGPQPRPAPQQGEG